MEKAEKEKQAGNLLFKEGKYGLFPLDWHESCCFSFFLKEADPALGLSAEAKSHYDAGMKYTKSLFKVKVFILI